jgi:ATP-binding protein involved in chromosome partitioning
MAAMPAHVQFVLPPGPESLLHQRNLTDWAPGNLGVMAVSRDAVLGALEGVIDPELKRSVVELDMVRDVHVDGGDVSVTIALTVPGCPLRASFEEQVEEALRPVEGIRSVALGFDVLTPEERQALTAKLRGDVAERSPGVSIDAGTRVIAVASGKGGVGKSSLTANLAAAFSQLGRATGVLDADVYGYSIPTMLGISQRPVAVDKMIVPPVRGDLKVMSIGFFLDENSPVMWRGPMLHRALEQFLSDVHWGELDTLVVDMPPGTGDVAISLGQLLPRAEAVVVTTPHRAAQQVAVRAAQMARKTNMRLLGVVENLSFQVGTGDELFGSGGGDALAEEVGAPILGRIPFDPKLAAYADEGEPIVLAEPEAEVSQAIMALAEAIAATKREQGVGIVKPLPLLSA